jgi:vacuolar-type H+-ATPase subunit I/STV1
MTVKKVHVEVLATGADAFQTLRAIVEAYTEYKIVAEQEQTKRREIEAWEKATISKIQAQRDVMICYLEKSFDERAKKFRFLFEKLDQAIAEGDNNQLTAYLHSITEIAKSSPFKDFADLKSVTAALDDPDHEWII